MRRREDWMTMRDDVLLEFLAEVDCSLPPGAIHHNLVDLRGIDVSRRTVNRRLKELLEHGLVEKTEPERGMYRISEKGRRYLSGE